MKSAARHPRRRARRTASGRETIAPADTDDEMAAGMPRPRGEDKDRRCSGRHVSGPQTSGNARSVFSSVRVSSSSESRQHHLALRLSALDERVGAAQVFGVDGAQLVVDGAADAAGVHQLGYLGQ